MEPRRGDKLAWGVALVAAILVIIVVMLNGDALEQAFSSDHGGSGERPTTGDGGRQEVR